MIWCCPRCFGDLVEKPGEAQCIECGAVYPIVQSIPDLRVQGRAWLDVEEDAAQARRLAEEFRTRPLAELVRSIFASRPGWSNDRVERRTSSTLALPDRLADDLDSWLSSLCEGSAHPVLDVGCGSGGLITALARRGVPCAGVDVSLSWLVVAKRAVEDSGGQAVLAAAFAEHLPVRSGTFGGVALLDVLEHVDGPGEVVADAARVLRPGGFVAAATPNRFSLAAEPHVGLWGVGWLPRPLQDGYVRARTGEAYGHTSPRSVREVERMFRVHTSLEVTLSVPTLPASEIATFSPWKKRVARVFNTVASSRGLRPLLLLIGPFFRLEARKAEQDVPLTRSSRGQEPGAGQCR